LKPNEDLGPRCVLYEEAGVEDGEPGIHYVISQEQDVEQCTGTYAAGTNAHYGQVEDRRLPLWGSDPCACVNESDQFFIAAREAA
jgi:hypothetical protein